MKFRPDLRFSLLWVWLLGAVSLAGAVLLLIENRGGFPVPVLLGLSALVIFFLTFRALVLIKRIRGLLEHLLRNDYETGMRMNGWFDDEVQAIFRKANRAASQLREYDGQCSDRIRLLKMQLDTVLRSSSDAVMIADMKAESFRINPAMKKLFAVEQDSFSFDSIRKQDGNERFFRSFLVAALRTGVSYEGAAPLQLPLRESRRNVRYRIVPVKSSQENTAFTLIFLNLEEDGSSVEPSAGASSLPG
jgi:hypothetical protein